jgi:hypothetical protein
VGFATYYSKCIRNFSELVAPLTDLLKGKSSNTVCWSAQCEVAFQRLKAALVSAPVLRSPDFSRQFIVQTDASDIGLGAVLAQVFEDGEHPILYASRKLLQRERAYSAVEKECLGVVWAVRTFACYLEGVEFVVMTDHMALKWLDRVKDNNSRLLRWSLALQSYKFEVIHRAGSKNVNADFFSRY